MPPVPKVGRRQRLGEEEPVDRAADEVDEEAEAEDAEDDRRHAGQVVDGDAHGADERALPRVLAQVERGEHAERGDHERHDEHHHHRAEDRREDAALGVRLARIVGDELPDPGQRRAAPWPAGPWRSGGTTSHDLDRAAAPSPCRRPPSTTTLARLPLAQLAEPRLLRPRTAPASAAISRCERLDLRPGGDAPAARGARRPSRICSCAWLIAPISPFSMLRISPTGARRARAAGARARPALGSAPVGDDAAPPSRTSLTSPIRSPHSMRSITTTSGGSPARAMCASSTQRKSAP